MNTVLKENSIASEDATEQRRTNVQLLCYEYITCIKEIFFFYCQLPFLQISRVDKQIRSVLCLSDQQSNCEYYVAEKINCHTEIWHMLFIIQNAGRPQRTNVQSIHNEVGHYVYVNLKYHFLGHVRYCICIYYFRLLEIIITPSENKKSL